MKLCGRCKKHAVPEQERLCQDCGFVYSLVYASVAIIIAGAFFIAALSIHVAG